MSARRLLRFLRSLLSIRFRFFTVVAVLAGLICLNLYWFWADFSAMAGRVTGQRTSEEVRWQAFTSHYAQLFGMLREGARFGIQEKGQTAAGWIIERRPRGLEIYSTLSLKNEGPGVVMVLEPDVKQELLGSVPDRDPEDIWQWMKDLLNQRRITIYSHPDLEKLEKGGYLAFMRAVDTRPPGQEWPKIRRMLGEIE